MRRILFAALLATTQVALVANSPASQAATLTTTSSYYEYNADPNVGFYVYDTVPDSSGRVAS